MSISDWIAIVCATLSTLVTIIIGILQCRQSRRMERFEQQQKDRDDKRREAKIKADATRFISNHYNDRGLIPLCVMASMHNSLFYYNRKMYREFCCLTEETQNRILEYLESDLTVREVKGFFYQCIDALQEEFEKRIGGNSIYTDYEAKYLMRCLGRYGEVKLHCQQIKWTAPNDLSTTKGKFFEEIRKNKSSTYAWPIEYLFLNFNSPKPKKISPQKFDELKQLYHFNNSLEVEACRFVATFSQYLAYYATDFKYDNKMYRLLNEYNERFTMEDLFLQTLLEVYVYLIRPKQSSKEQADLK